MQEAVSKGEASVLGVRSLSSSLRSELETIRGEMRTELQQKFAAAIDKWQVRMTKQCTTEGYLYAH